MECFGADHFGCEGERCGHGLFGKVRIGPKNSISGSPLCEVFQDHFYSDPGPSDDRTASANSRIGVDERFPIHVLNIPHSPRKAKPDLCFWPIFEVFWLPNCPPALNYRPFRPPLSRGQKEPDLGDQGIGLGEKSSDIVQPSRPFNRGSGAIRIPFLL